MKNDDLLKETRSFTKIDNTLNDYYLKVLSPSEYKLIMCIIRHTIGFQRKQFKTQITSLSKLVNMTRNTTKSALSKLEDDNFIEIKREDKHIIISYLRSNSKIQFYETIISSDKEECYG